MLCSRLPAKQKIGILHPVFFHILWCQNGSLFIIIMINLSTTSRLGLCHCTCQVYKLLMLKTNACSTMKPVNAPHCFLKVYSQPQEHSGIEWTSNTFFYCHFIPTVLNCVGCAYATQWFSGLLFLQY